jgi:integrase
MIKPKKIDTITPDTEQSGLWVRTRVSGGRTIKRFVVMYRVGKQQRRYTLKAGLTAQQARKEAKKLIGKIAGGEDPQAAKKATRTTATVGSFKHIAEQFLEHQATRQDRPRRDKTIKLAALYLRKHCRHLHGEKANAVTLEHIRSTLQSIAKTSGAVTSDRVRATLSAMYAWAISEGYCGNNYSNPVTDTKKRIEEYVPIDRVLKPAEIAAIWDAAGDSDFGRIVKLLILTGARRDEIASLRWDEIEGDLITLPGERTKNHRKFEIPLSKLAKEVIGAKPEPAPTHVFGRLRGAGFSGFSKAKAQLDAKLGLGKPWRLHDIRHTVSTGMSELTDKKGKPLVEPHIVEAVLNHVSGYKAGIAGRYNAAAYRDPKRKALADWANHIAAIVSPNVILMSKKKAS